MKKMNTTIRDNSKKRILARGCDPILSANFARLAPKLTGNAEYVPTTDDSTFIKLLQEEKWSVVYFAPGACRYNAANVQIPGSNQSTTGWSLEQYRELIYELQGENIQIVETPFEEESLRLLNEALSEAIETI